MNKLGQYLTSNLSAIFFPIFLTLFIITSVIYLVKIASLTSIITIDFFELLFLYTLQIPNVLFYTLPVTFFVSATINIAKLSGEYELIVITSFGFSPLRIMYLLIPSSLLLSILLFLISFVLIPKAYYFEKNFLNQKKQEARFNIKPSEYGQKFGPWYIYVNSKEKDDYKNIMLYQNKNGKDTFIIASKANLHNKISTLSLELFEGSSSIISDKLEYVQFAKMIINNHLERTKRLSSFKDLINYWIININSNNKWIFLKNIFISILPIISILYYVALGYFNPRYEKNFSALFSIVVVIVYIMLMQKLSNSMNMNYLYIFPLSWIFVSYLVYTFRVKKYY
jgi:lipopolysaccharide export system permease protein